MIETYFLPAFLIALGLFIPFRIREILGIFARVMCDLSKLLGEALFRHRVKSYLQDLADARWSAQTNKVKQCANPDMFTLPIFDYDTRTQIVISLTKSELRKALDKVKTND
jgi:hypothetical protein